MKTVYKVLLVNGSCLLGFIVVGVANPDAPAVIFGISCFVVIALMNGAFFLLPWLRRRGYLAKSTAPPQSSSEYRFWIAFGWILFALSLLLTWMERHGYW